MDKAKVRALFPVTSNVTYLNHAAVGPLSRRAAEAMEWHARDQRDFGALHWRDWYAEHDALRASAARLLGSSPHEIAILKNTSEGVSFVAEGIRWREGDNVITTSLEFPSNAVPWKRLVRRGVECRIAPDVDGVVSVEAIERLIDDRTRVVTVSSVAFHNGFAADVEAIGALCEERGVLLCVDAIQSLGVVPIDVKRAKVAFLSADGHKWLCGPEGAAVFYVDAARLEELEVIESGWTNLDRKGKFIDCAIDLLPDNRRFEAGSLNTNGIYGLRAAIDLLLELGIEAVHAEVVRLATKFAALVEERGFRVHTPRPIASGIVGITPPDVEQPSILRYHRELEAERIVCAPREGMLRFSPHFYNDDAELERTADVLARIAAR